MLAFSSGAVLNITQTATLKHANMPVFIMLIAAWTLRRFLEMFPRIVHTLKRSLVLSCFLIAAGMLFAWNVSQKQLINQSARSAHLFPNNEAAFSVNLFGMNISYPVAHHNFCTKLQVDRLLFVTTRSSAFSRRRAIRQTWGRFLQHRMNFTLIFFIGQISREHEEQFYMETKNSGDVVMADFKDSYRNLTVKTGVALFWIAKFCSEASIVIKSDDDTIILPDGLRSLLNYAKRENFTHNHILGWVYELFGPVRNLSSKWYLSEKDFPVNFFPSYCNGHAYVILGNETIHKLLTSVNQYKNLPIEDAFYTGILAEREEISRKIDYDVMLRITPYVWTANDSCFYNMVTAHYTGSVQDMRNYFKEYKSCRTNYCGFFSRPSLSPYCTDVEKLSF